jgi:hypothetical protein
MKKDGGHIKNWQLHTLIYKKAHLKLLKTLYPEAICKPSPLIVTGTIVDDPTGRWVPGYHFRSSLISKIDRKKNTIETINTIYHFDPKTEGMDGMPDINNKVLDIFY